MDGGADGFERAARCLAQQVLELGKDLLDRVEVGRVFRQEGQLGNGGADGQAYGFSFVTAEIINDDDVATPERGRQDLLDIGPEALAVEQSRRLDVM